MTAALLQNRSDKCATQNQRKLVTSPSETIVIVVTPASKPSLYEVRLDGQNRVLCVSRQPFLNAARKLLALGYWPSDRLVMLDARTRLERLSGLIGKAAKLTVDEHNGPVFAKWKGLRCSAGSARITANDSLATTLAETRAK